jgi:hypothetical protein
VNTSGVKLDAQLRRARASQGAVTFRVINREP